MKTHTPQVDSFTQNRMPAACFAVPSIRKQLPLLLKTYSLAYRAHRRLGNKFQHTSLKILRATQRIQGKVNRFGFIDLGDLKVHCDFSDPRFAKVIEESFRESAESKAIESILRQGGTFLDVGSNHGIYAARAARIVGNTGLVIAFEPQPNLASLIAKTLKASNQRSPSYIYRVACGSDSETKTIYSPKRNSGEASLYKNVADDDNAISDSVQAIRIDDLIDPTVVSQPVLVKIDVEGFEPEVLGGARTFLRVAKADLLLEINPRVLAKAETTVGHLITSLNEAGYEDFSTLDNLANKIRLKDYNFSDEINIVAWGSSPE